MKNLFDKIGICLSGLCIIHCISTPIILFLFPLAGNILESHFHEWLFFLLMVIALISFFSGYKTHHKKEPFYWFLGALASGYLQLVIFHDHNIIYSIITSALFIIAHIKNYNHCNKCINH